MPPDKNTVTYNDKVRVVAYFQSKNHSWHTRFFHTWLGNNLQHAIIYTRLCENTSYTFLFCTTLHCKNQQQNDKQIIPDTSHKKCNFFDLQKYVFFQYDKIFSYPQLTYYTNFNLSISKKSPTKDLTLNAPFPHQQYHYSHLHGQNHWNTVAELIMLCLMSEQPHRQQCRRTAPERGKPQQCRLRNAPPPTTRFPFVETINDERHDINRNKVIK